MYRLVLALFICGIVALGGCGDDDHDPPPPLVASIVSDAAFDGDIARSVDGTFRFAQGSTAQGIVKVGIDPVDGAEFRGFLDFPLGGNGGVPVNAFISWATLELSINNISVVSLIDTLPIRIDLVPFSLLSAEDFNSPPLASLTVSPPILQDPLGMFVRIDVTPLMVDAQRLVLSDFQVRIIRIQGASYDLIEINDTDLPPLLEVGYFL